MTFQHSMNGSLAVHVRSPLPGTIVNYVAGSIVLVLAWLIKFSVDHRVPGLPADPWLYLGEVLGWLNLLMSAVSFTSYRSPADGAANDCRATYRIPAPGLATALARERGFTVRRRILDAATPHSGPVLAYLHTGPGQNSPVVDAVIEGRKRSCRGEAPAGGRLLICRCCGPYMRQALSAMK
jgi:hypothetical protein